MHLLGTAAVTGFDSGFMPACVKTSHEKWQDHLPVKRTFLNLIGGGIRRDLLLKNDMIQTRQFSSRYARGGGGERDMDSVLSALLVVWTRILPRLVGPMVRQRRARPFLRWCMVLLPMEVHSGWGYALFPSGCGINYRAGYRQSTTVWMPDIPHDGGLPIFRTVLRLGYRSRATTASTGA